MLTTNSKKIISAAPDLVMALIYLTAWLESSALEYERVRYYALVILLELFAIHSAAFLGFAIFSGNTKTQKIMRGIGMGIIYSVFLWSFSVRAGEFWPLGAFWLLVFNRLLGVLLGQSDITSFRSSLLARWGWSAFCYVGSMVIATKVPMPQFGWSEVATSQSAQGLAGLWFAQPHMLFAAGFFYFLAVGIFELLSHRLSHRLTAVVTAIEPALTNLLRKR